jgi:hypothetical protein
MVKSKCEFYGTCQALPATDAEFPDVAGNVANKTTVWSLKETQA